MRPTNCSSLPLDRPPCTSRNPHRDRQSAYGTVSILFALVGSMHLLLFGFISRCLRLTTSSLFLPVPVQSYRKTPQARQPGNGVDFTVCRRNSAAHIRAYQNSDSSSPSVSGEYDATSPDTNYLRYHRTLLTVNVARLHPFDPWAINKK